MSFLYSGLYTGCSRTSLETEIKTAVRLAKLVTEEESRPRIPPNALVQAYSDTLYGRIISLSS